MQRLSAITHVRFGLFRVRSPLLTESLLFSFPVGTEMFHFPTFPLPALCVQAGVTGLASSRVSPFGNPRITVWLPTPRGLSQAPTSFIGSWYQDIHRLPLVACHYKNKQNYATKRCSRPLYSSQNTGRNTNPEPPPARQTPNPRETTHPEEGHPHQPFGESRPQPPHPTLTG